MDEGWTRFIFDQNHIPYTRLVDADIRKGDLNHSFDVIVLPDNSPRAITSGSRGFGEGEAPAGNNSAGAGAGTATARRRAATDDGGTPAPQTPPEFTGGLGPDGVSALQAFTENGGSIVTFNRASEIYLKKGTDIENAFDNIDRKEFYIPGSILQVTVDPSNPIAFGSTPTVPIFYENGPLFNVRSNSEAQSIASFTSDSPLLSGWILGGKYLKGTSIIAQQNVGKGHLILFGFRPQYRAISEVTYKFLFNALLYSSSQPETIGASSASLQPGSETTTTKGGEQ